jgi:type I site-specific restriction endonuclease
MQRLNLPEVELRIRTNGERKEVFDDIRKSFVALTPEEWVRQHFVHYLVDQKLVPRSLIAVEASLTVNRMKKRADIIVYRKNGTPCLIVECKAPEVKMTQAAFDQAAVYNMSLQVPYLVVTNGLTHFACRIDKDKGKIEFLKELPEYNNMI